MGRCSVLKEVLSFEYASKLPSTETKAMVVNVRNITQSITFTTFLRYVDEVIPAAR